jgi:predicted CoA-binding protein
MMNQSSDTANWTNPQPAELKQIIGSSKTIAIVGLSSKEARPSNRVGRYLKDQGFEIIPVNPMESDVLGEKSYPDIASIGKSVDIVDVFRRGEDTPPIVEEAIRCGAKCIWLQEGVVSKESYDLATEAGIPIVMDACLLVEHKRLSS